MIFHNLFSTNVLNFNRNKKLRFLIFTLIRNIKIIRFFLKLLFKEFKKIDFDEIQGFLYIRIGFFSKSQHYSFPLHNYIALDYYNKVGINYYLNLKKIPCKSNKVADISVKHFFEYFPKKKYWRRAIKNWYKKLIPGGILKFFFYRDHNATNTNLPDLIETLKKSNFEILNYNENELFGNLRLKLYELTCYKKTLKYKFSRTVTHEKNLKLKVIKKIIHGVKESYYKGKKVCIIGRNKIKLEVIEDKVKYVEYFSSFSGGIKNKKDLYDFGIIYDTLEYHSRNELYKIFQITKNIFKPKSKILMIFQETDPKKLLRIIEQKIIELK